MSHRSSVSRVSRTLVLGGNFSAADPGPGGGPSARGASHPHPVPAVGRCAGTMAAPSSPAAPSATRRARGQCMEVATCTQGCARCHNHTNPAGAYGVSVAGVSGESPARGRPRSRFTEPARPAGSRIRRSPLCPGRLAGSPDGCPARTGETTDRASDPDRRLDRQPPHEPAVALEMCHWDTPDQPSSPDQPHNQCAGWG